MLSDAVNFLGSWPGLSLGEGDTKNVQIVTGMNEES